MERKSHIVELEEKVPRISGGANSLVIKKDALFIQHKISISKVKILAKLNIFSYISLPSVVGMSLI